MQKKALDRFEAMMDRFEKRMELDAKVTGDLSKLVRKTTEKLDSHGAAPLTVSSPPDNAGEDEIPEPGSGSSECMHNEVNLLTLGGITDVDKAKRIAAKLWSPEELKLIVIDPKRAPADEERTEKYRKAVRTVFGSRYSEKLYRYTLRLVNQQGLDALGSKLDTSLSQDNVRRNNTQDSVPSNTNETNTELETVNSDSESGNMELGRAGTEVENVNPELENGNLEGDNCNVIKESVIANKYNAYGEQHAMIKKSLTLLQPSQSREKAKKGVTKKGRKTFNEPADC